MPIVVGGVFGPADIIILNMATLMTVFPFSIFLFCFLMLRPAAQHALDPDFAMHGAQTSFFSDSTVGLEWGCLFSH